MTWETVEGLAILGSLLVLIWQTRALKIEIARGEMQSVYNRYLELTKIEAEDPILHKMFLYGRDFERFSQLSEQELHERALSLLIFDQFALLFNMSRQPLHSKLLRWVARKWRWLGEKDAFQSFIDRHRSIWEINAEYVAGVLTNPLLIRSWREWGLGETWKGSQFFIFVESIMDQWEREMDPDRTTKKATKTALDAVAEGEESM